MTTATKTTAKFDSINVEAMEAWLTELERGEIKQAQSVLHEVTPDKVSMCCLGVASYVHAEVCGLVVDKRVASPDYAKVYYNGQGGYLPRAVAKHLGIPDSHLDYKAENTVTILVTPTKEEAALYWGYGEENDLVSVAYLNDSKKFTFSDIARMLRREFLHDSEEASDSGNVKEAANA